MNHPFDPNRKPLWLPKQMQFAPPLPTRCGPFQPHSILLINRFYPKDPHASFGKHVLTPTLTLTSIAAATPPERTFRYWDETLLQGPVPIDSFPRLVGFPGHLPFSKRAYELADWFRSCGAVVIVGGLHVLS